MRILPHGSRIKHLFPSFRFVYRLCRLRGDHVVRAAWIAAKASTAVLGL